MNAGARAELHIDASALRLSSNSNFGILNLDDSIAQLSLNEGILEIRLRQLDQNSVFEIDTPNGAITLQRAGEYRIDTNPDRNSTLVTVRSGQAEMYQDGNSILITPHQTVYFRDGSGPDVEAELGRDDFDAFVTSRNNAEDALPRRDYVPDSMIGADDLYAYGRWTNDPLYGQVWMPPVDAGWAPYTTGRWVFVEPWGWTWVDEAPWGFAPFHYGRWAQVRGGWAWIPGARTYRPVYSPALVGFIGGGGFGISVGWFPLGPREPWVPAWGSRAYVNRVNVMHVTNINVINVNVTNINYVNRQNVTVISRADFAGARPVRGTVIRMSPAQARDGQVLGFGPQIAPVRASIAIGPARQAPAFTGRVVVARTPPPPAQVSFQARQQLLNQNNGQPLRRNQVEQLRTQQPTAVVAPVQVRQIGAPRNDAQQQQQPQQPQRGRGFGQAPAAPAPAPAVVNPVPPQNQAPQNQAPTNQPRNNRVPDRMNSRPQSAPAPAAVTPAPAAAPAQATPAPTMRNRPAPQPEAQQPPQNAAPAPGTRNREPQVAPQPQAQRPPTPPAAQPTERPAAPAETRPNQARPQRDSAPAKQTRGRGSEEQKDEKK